MNDPKVSAREAGLRYVASSEPGLSRRMTSLGFVYRRPDGGTVKDKATLDRIRDLVIPPAWTNVWICARPNGHLQATGVDARGRKQYRYHPDYRQTRDATKFGRMLAFGRALPAIRRRLKRDLALPGLPKKKVLAAVVTLLDRTCIRVGNDEYAEQNGSYGLTTLHDRHVDITHGHIRFHFKGKSGQFHRCDLADPRLARIVKRCREIPGHELFQYRSGDGRHSRIDSADVNGYIREISGSDYTAKDFRTWHGTGHALAYLMNLGRADKPTQAKRNLIAAVKATAEYLGNRPATCRKYYIHPAVTSGYQSGTLFAAMSSFGKKTGGYEVAVELLIRRYNR